MAAADPESALRRWADQIKPIDIAHFGEGRKAELADAIDEWLASGERMAAITGTRNVWCHMASIGGFLMLINMVATKTRAVGVAGGLTANQL